MYVRLTKVKPPEPESIFYNVFLKVVRMSDVRDPQDERTDLLRYSDDLECKYHVYERNRELCSGDVWIERFKQHGHEEFSHAYDFLGESAYVLYRADGTKFDINEYLKQHVEHATSNPNPF